MSATPIRRLHDVEQDAGDPWAQGLWYSIGTGYLRAAHERGQFDVISGRLVYELAIIDARILRIATADELDRFEEECGTPAPEAFMFGRSIDWRRVAERFDGLEIAPHRADRDSRAAEHAWYEPWTVAQGVLWRPRRSSVRLIARLPGVVRPKTSALSSSRVRTLAG